MLVYGWLRIGLSWEWGCRGVGVRVQVIGVGWDRRCQDPGARGLGPGGGVAGGPIPSGGGSNT